MNGFPGTFAPLRERPISLTTNQGSVEIEGEDSCGFITVQLRNRDVETLSCTATVAGGDESFDVVVYGGTSAGIVA